MICYAWLPADLFCRHLLWVKDIGDKLYGILTVICPTDNPAATVCTLYTLLDCHHTRLRPSATTKAHLFLCQWTLYILIVGELNNLICDDVLLRALTPFDDLELGIVLQAADEPVTGFVKLFP